MANWLSKQRTIAHPDYNRWLVPPAALAIHLSIGMAYGFSVFWIPLEHAVGISEAVPCDTDTGDGIVDSLRAILGYSDSGPCDWQRSTLGWLYTLFFVFLGSSAAVFGHWVEREGPRKAGVYAAYCWAGGFLISAAGVYWHHIWLLWLGSGVIGGIGLGLGYISPVSTLIKWFPDRRGMATGMAIMGFGGGAMIGAPLADLLMKYYAGADSVGVWETFVTLSAIYFVAMMGGAFGYRVPPLGWTPPGWQPNPNRMVLQGVLYGRAVVAPPGWQPNLNRNGMITSGHVHLNMAHKTPHFWLLWGVLCLNVSAGIGVIGVASPMLQEVFGGKLIGLDMPLKDLTVDQAAQVATIAAAFTGLLSLFNIAGRIGWASLSDYIGRKRTYFLFFSLGAVLYAAAPFAGEIKNVALFVAIFCFILTMYGGGFATIPAYLADIFGTQFVGAIHGRLLTAWSTAGVLGPVLVNYLREYQVGLGVPVAQAYNTTMYVLAGLLVIGFFCNLAMRPVAPKYYMSDEELATERRIAHEGGLENRN